MNVDISFRNINSVGVELDRRISPPKTRHQYPWVDNWLMAIFPLGGRVKSCKVLQEVWLSKLGQMSDPSLAWQESDVFKIKDCSIWWWWVLVLIFMTDVTVCHMLSSDDEPVGSSPLDRRMHQYRLHCHSIDDSLPATPTTSTACTHCSTSVLFILLHGGKPIRLSINIIIIFFSYMVTVSH